MSPFLETIVRLWLSFRKVCRRCGKRLDAHYGDGLMCEPPPPVRMRSVRFPTRFGEAVARGPNLDDKLLLEEYERQKILSEERRKKDGKSD